MSEHDDFFARLRADARPLRHQPAPADLARIRARIVASIERPTVTQLLAAWFRPVLATVAAIAAVAVFTLASRGASEEQTWVDQTIEISMGGDSYSVGH